MTSTISHLFIFSSIIPLIISYVIAQSNPQGLALPVIRDYTTNQYIVNITQGTPFKSIPFTLDLGGQFLWVNCDISAYNSSTYRPARCGSPQCKLANSNSCNNNTCGLNPGNPFIRTATSGYLGSDFVRIRTTDGSSLGRPVTVSNSFVCTPKSLTKGLAKGVQGIAGLGRTKVSLSSQLSSALKFPQTFAICLSSTSDPGVVFFGDVPYKFVYSPIVIDVRTIFSYTPLLVNPNSTSQSTEYFIGVKSIKINNKNVAINTKFLTLDKDGNGGTKISTIEPYTVMQTSIYKAVTQSFEKELPIGKRIKGVGQFEVCYDPSSLSFSKRGADGPDIELVLQNQNVKWRISSTNYFVSVGNAYCLGFVDGGPNSRSAIVIGSFQLQDNLVQFDLVKSRLGFSNALFDQMNRCDNFNFTFSN